MNPEDKPNLAAGMDALIERMKQFAALLSSGCNLSDAALAKNLSLPVAKFIAYQIGWTKRCRARRCGAYPIEDVVKMFQGDNMGLTEIAAKSGVTRQCVAQALQNNGIDTHAVFSHRMLEQKQRSKEILERVAKANRAVRVENTFDHYAPWRELWDQGLTIKQMAERLVMTSSSVGSTISNLRIKFGWFPYRHYGYSKQLKKDFLAQGTIEATKT